VDLGGRVPVFPRPSEPPTHPFGRPRFQAAPAKRLPCCARPAGAPTACPDGPRRPRSGGSASVGQAVSRRDGGGSCGRWAVVRRRARPHAGAVGRHSHNGTQSATTRANTHPKTTDAIVHIHAKIDCKTKFYRMRKPFFLWSVYCDARALLRRFGRSTRAWATARATKSSKT
jgi:hypothetical protein